MTDNEVLLETSIKTTDSFSEGNDFEVNDDAVKVKGFSAHVGVMNRQTFTKEALEKAASSFVGVPIVALHSDGTEVVVGTTHYTDVRYDDSCGKDGLYYEGEMGNEYNETKNVANQLVNVLITLKMLILIQFVMISLENILQLLPNQQIETHQS